MKTSLSSCFSKQLYIQGLKKSKNTALGCAVTFIVINAIYAYNDTLIAPEWSSTLTAKIENILQGAILIFPVAFLIIGSCFSFLNKRKSSDFYHALPQKRLCVYVSLVSSALTWLVGIILVAVMVCSFIFQLSSAYQVDFANVMLSFTGTVLACFSAVGIFLVCRMVSGTATSFVFYSALLFIVPRILVYLFLNVLAEVNFITASAEIRVNFFTAETTPLFLFFGADAPTFTNYEKIPFIIIESVIESALLFVFGGYLYIKQKSENAEKPVASKIAHTLYRLLLTSAILFFVIASSLVDGIDVPLLIIVSTVAFVVHFLFDLILSKSPKKAFKSLPWFCLSFSVALGLLFSTFSVGEYYKKTIPSENSISSISFGNIKLNSYLGIYDYEMTYALGASHRNYYGYSTSNKEAHKALVEDLRKTAYHENRSGMKYTVKITLENGKTISRAVRISNESYITIFSAIKEENAEALALPSWYNVTSSSIYEISGDFTTHREAKQEIYSSFVKEYNALSPQEQLRSERYELSEGTYSFCFNTETEAFQFYVSKDLFPQTYDLIIRG